ncbi:MAG: hypothetical protein GMKNLPBB_02320 [Myxococcota bacterium]|nr:hypothetical protein [Myxococcota bacterium]
MQRSIPALTAILILIAGAAAAKPPAPAAATGTETASPAAGATSAASTAPADISLTAEEHLSLGAAAFRVNDFDKALWHFEEANKQYRNYPPALILRANARFATGQFGGAGADLTQAIASSPTAIQEIHNVRDMWRDFETYQRRFDELGLRVNNGEASMQEIILFGFYYQVGGYPGDARKVLEQLDARGREATAAKRVAEFEPDYAAWIDLPEPPEVKQPKQSRRKSSTGGGGWMHHEYRFRAPSGPPPPSIPPPPKVIRFPDNRDKRLFTLGFDIGGGYATGKLGRYLRAGPFTRFFFAFLPGRFEADLSFAFRGLDARDYISAAGNKLVPFAFVNDNFFGFSLGVDGAYHFLPKKSVFDPALRLGYDAHFIQLVDMRGRRFQEHPTELFVRGHGPKAAADFNFPIPFIMTDFVLGLSTSYSVFIVQDEAGRNFDGGILDVAIRLGFRF